MYRQIISAATVFTLGMGMAWAQDIPSGPVQVPDTREPRDRYISLEPPADMSLVKDWDDKYSKSDEEVGKAASKEWNYTDEQVNALLQVYLRMNGAGTLKTVPPTLRSRTITASLLPQGNPPVIYFEPNYPTAVTFKDVTGAPWNVEKVIGDKSYFAEVDEDTDSPTIYITPTVDDQGNTFNGSILVKLEDLAVPLVFELRDAVANEKGARNADSGIEVLVPKPGPAARVQDLMNSEAFEAGDAVVRQFLHGYVPEGARPLSVTPGSAELRAWKYGDHVYLKTFGRMILPEPLAAERSPSGASVFKLNDVPRAMIAVNGVKTRLVIRERRLADGQ